MIPLKKKQKKDEEYYEDEDFDDEIEDEDLEEDYEEEYEEEPKPKKKRGKPQKSNNPEIDENRALLAYEILLLDLKDIETQVIQGRINLKSDKRMNGLMSESDMLALMRQKQEEVINFKNSLVNSGIDIRSLEDIEKKVKEGAKEYDYLIVDKK